jgi:hypothetical protein
MEPPGRSEGPSASRREADERMARYPLLAALIERRSRRFGHGMNLNGGPLAYDSASAPLPLTLEEEAALAFAGCGITGYTLAELPYESGTAPEAGGGNILINFVGRTVASGDAVHAVALFVINDEGAWMLKRPQDYPRTEIAGLARVAREHELVELYEKGRVRIAEGRPDVPRELPFVMLFNKWTANLPGTTYFLPVNDFTALYIKVRPGNGRVSRRGRRHELEGWIRRSGGHSSLLGSRHRRHNRLLRVRLRALRAVPRQQRSVPYGARTSGPSPGSDLLRPVLPPRYVDRNPTPASTPSLGSRRVSDSVVTLPRVLTFRRLKSRRRLPPLLHL